LRRFPDEASVALRPAALKARPIGSRVSRGTRATAGLDRFHAQNRRAAKPEKESLRDCKPRFLAHQTDDSAAIC
jgi:hypothetical protein